MKTTKMPPRFLSVSFHSGRTICLSDILRPPTDGKFYILQRAEIINSGETEDTFQIGLGYTTEILDVDEITLLPKETKEIKMSALTRAIATGVAGWTTMEIQARTPRRTNVEPFQLQLLFYMAPTRVERGLLETQAREAHADPALRAEFLTRLLEV